MNNNAHATKNRTRKQAVVITLLSLSLGLLTVLAGCDKKQQAAQVMKRGPVEVEVVTLRPQPEKLEVELPGRTVAFRVAEVRPQVSGIIQKRFFTEGSEVTAGEQLYQIDPATYQAQYDSAKAALMKAKATEASAKLKAERYSNLVKTKAVSELDQVEAEAAWQQAKADIASAEAALNSAHINLEYTKITAPISGRIGKSMFTEGALVTAQQTGALATIQQLDPIYVDVTQSSTDLRSLRRELSDNRLASGAQLSPTVSVLFEDGSLYPQQGSLQFSDVTVEQSTGTVTLRAIVANPQQELLPGMFVRAKIDKGIKEDALLVPAAGISRNSKGQATVMLVNSESKVESRVIQSGQTFGDKTMIDEGLNAGDRVIVAGLQNIKPGLTVVAVEKADSSLAALTPGNLEQVVRN